jgi:hypothetical protein
MTMMKFVRWEDCEDIAVGGEDEMIEKIDAAREEEEGPGLWSHRADLENWMDDFEEN